MTVREPLPAPDRSRRPGPKGKVGQRPDRLPGPRDAAPARAAALSGEVGRRRQPQPGKMFNVESAERVELCESLLTWVWMTGGAGKTPARPPRAPQTAFPGSPLCSSRGASAQDGGAVTSGAWGGRSRGRAGAAASAPVAGPGSAGRCLPGAGASARGRAETSRAGGVGPVEANDGVQAAL